MNRSLLLAVLLFGACAISASGQTLRSAIADLGAYCATSQHSKVEYIREWGFPQQALVETKFTRAVEMVSNNWFEIVADWNYYATNDESRLLLGKTISFAGTNAFVNTWSNLVDKYEEQGDPSILQFVDEIHAPASGPLAQYVYLNCDIPVISNCLVRSRALYPATNATMRAYYDEILSGFRRDEIMAIREMGQTTNPSTSDE